MGGGGGGGREKRRASEEYNENNAMNECLLFIRFLIMYGIQLIVCSLDYKVEISVCHIYWPDLQACMLYAKHIFIVTEMSLK